MKKSKLFSFLILIIIIVFFLILRAGFNRPNSNINLEKQFIIEKGQGVKMIAQNLADQGFLKNPWTFKVYVALKGARAEFIDGTYQLRLNVTIKELLRAFQEQANGTREVSVTIVEGWTQAEIDNYLAQQGLIVAGVLIHYNTNDWDFLKDRSWRASLEGYLYPDTYRIYRQTSVEEIVQKMMNNFGAKLTDDLRQEIKRQSKTIYEMVTLASIVEKEMFDYENRQKVAGIFWKRLKNGMPLQSDATVDFVTNKGTARPSVEDTQIDSPYNTYKYKGLPPGPICNPSLEAIRAVIYPESTDYWYFLTTPDNQIIFSKTYDEHLTNKYKYLK